MSVDGTKLLFEGFLQKRKDTVKLRWVTYWFRLQNTTLFFYTTKNGSASNLRGYYYIQAVQSVREVQKADKKRFIFEIIMTNGKKKVLAAETEDLRKEWVGHLWQAMHLFLSETSVSTDAQLDVCEQRDRLHSITPICSQRESVMEELPVRPLSAPAPSDYIYAQPHRLTRPTKETCQPEYTCPPKEQDNEEEIYQNTLQAYQNYNDDDPNDPQWSSRMSNTEAEQEGDYDVLPVRKRSCELNLSAEVEEDVYDVPVSCRRSSEPEDPRESVYDVPSSLLRNISDHTIDEQPEEGTYWNI
ncbi:uncharacterized protein LOC115784432 [Archocentrus centrarchus]|uniref:uncharacterized protein LOC115784432 n=1 Tax=Archocentrus centrarchus TaxID=63155 RepID=UPI0011E9CE3A|nr:uncharacterized protein LOC115784432 [Archocentrus centrarchus]